MPRLRIRFSKRGYACFISHIDLPILFSRAARRAGLEPEQTQGFSPHPRTALGPPLPVGVIGIAEPADFWFAEWPQCALERWSASLPEGLQITSATEVDVSGVSLNKLCKAAGYEILPPEGTSAEKVLSALADSMGESGSVLDIGVTAESHALDGSNRAGEAENEYIRIFVKDIERSSASRMVKILVERELASGWEDLAIARCGVGIWDDDAKRIIEA